MNASHLWWLVCWCEYSKTLGKAVQSWRIGASRFEWQNTKWKACDFKWSASSRLRWRTDPWKLGFQNVCARWVPCMLSDEMKAERFHISWELLEHFEKEGEDFLKKSITGDETWVHHYDPENKRQSMEYCHKESPQLKIFKTQASAGKAMLTVFWNSECCSCRLPWKRNNNKLSTLHWNSYCIKKKNWTDWNKKWNTSSTRQCQASHKCSNKRCNLTPGLSSAAAPTI